MWQYWVMFLIPAWLSLKFPYRPKNMDKPWNELWKIYFVFIVLMIGYRYQVGGDWDSYNLHILYKESLNFEFLDLTNEPIFALLSWFGAKWGGIYLFNLFSGLLFSYGLIQLSLKYSRPWLCIAISTPYLIIVVAMGYSRQAGALGAFMLGLGYLLKGDIRKYIFWILVGAAMHKSVIFTLVFAPINKKKLSMFNIVFILGVIFGFYLISEKYFMTYYKSYIMQEYSSAGAIIRASLNLVPSLIYLFLRKNFIMFSKIEHRLYMLLSILACSLFLALFYTNATTALDRISLYILPLQFIILGNLPDVLGYSKNSNLGWVSFILLIYAFVEYVWLFYADHSQYWIPYRFFLWEQLWG